MNKNLQTSVKKNILFDLGSLFFLMLSKFQFPQYVLFLSRIRESKTTVYETTVMENDAVRCRAVACEVARDQ